MTKKQNETLYQHITNVELNHDELQGIKDSIHLLFKPETDEKANEIVVIAEIMQERLAEKANADLK